MARMSESVSNLFEGSGKRTVRFPSTQGSPNAGDFLATMGLIGESEKPTSRTPSP
jgi:hypothetical protein